MSKILLAACALVIATLQAWDSRALAAEALPRALIVAGILLPASAIAWTTDVRVRGLAVLVAAIGLAAARVVSNAEMPGLALAAFFPGIIVLFDHVRSMNAARTKPVTRGRAEE